MWKSVVEIDRELRLLPNVSRLENLYGLRNLWLSAVYPANYQAADEWGSILTTSSQANTILKELGPLVEGLPEADIALAYFAQFFHHDLFIDYESTDATKIREILQRELLQEKIHLPYRFGRLLYDRFNDTYSDTRTDHLMSDEAERLLQGTPQGVYQLGPLLSGPLGILDSQETRNLPPGGSLPLWHCSDTGCNAIHRVGFVPASIAFRDALSRIDKALSDRLGPASEWDSALIWLHRERGRGIARPYIDLPTLIADCIVGEQRTVLLERALQGPTGAVLRGVLALPPRKKRDADGPPAELARRLTSEAQLQLLLVLSDRELNTIIDDSVYTKRIRIPLGETRQARYIPPSLSGDSASQLSALGLRSVLRDPVVNLTSAVWRAYQQMGHANELEWRVRGDVARSSYEALVAFVRTRGPAEAVRELVLSSGAIAKIVCDELQVDLKYASATDNLAVDRLLWKLGFYPMQFDDSISRFRARLYEFNQAILANTPIVSEDAREHVRAAGVNVFVSVEDFIDRLVSYNIWVLSSDHFLGTNFRYSSADARRSVPDTLGAIVPSGEIEVRWSLDGENPLGTLLRYLRVSTEWLQSLPDRNRDDLERPESDLPHFASDERLPFPFRHLSLWADSDLIELRGYGEGFGRIVKLVEESELASVLNGLDHFREGERFPSADKLLACAVRLNQALELADAHRYLPKVYWLFDTKGTRFGSIEYEFRDYAGRAVFAYGPPLVSGIQAPAYESAFLMPPANLLGTPNASILFQLREQSEFSVYWQDYPRRRHIPGVSADELRSEESDVAVVRSGRHEGSGT